ncbi:Cytochrome P450 86B1 [Linum perenne]
MDNNNISMFTCSPFFDLSLVLFFLFLFCSLIERISTKGPMLWPVLGIIPTLLAHTNDVYGFITDALIKAGGTFHYRGMWMGGAHGVVTCDPVNIEYMLRTNFVNFPKGRYFRERFQDLLGDGIFNSDDQPWKEQRGVAKTEMYSTQFIEHSFRVTENLVHEKLIKVMEKMMITKKNESFDLQEVLLRFTFDSICSVAFGVDSSESTIPFARAFEEATELTLTRFMIPPFIWKPMKWLGIGYERKLKEVVEVVHKFADEIVKERKANLRKSNHQSDDDLLSRLILRNRQEFSDKYLRDFCVSFILAGRDTTSVGLAWFFWLVGNNPRVETKILDEICRILRKKPDKGAIVFNAEDLKSMVYLEAALSESMRLYPPVPTEMKEVTRDDVLPNGSIVKSGGRVLYSVYSMARMESVWGKDCLEFKPERWIRDGKVVSENQFKYAVFNGGPRLCLGKKFAYTQMKMVAASILLRFQVRVVNGHSVVPKVTTTLYMKEGLKVKLKARVVKIW